MAAGLFPPDFSPLPRGEGDPRPALSSAGAGPVRGSLISMRISDVHYIPRSSIGGGTRSIDARGGQVLVDEQISGCILPSLGMPKVKSWSEPGLNRLVSMGSSDERLLGGINLLGETMKKNLRILTAVAVVCLGLSVTSAKDPGPVSGTWSCVGHSEQSGDTPFTFTLTQVGDKVNGKFEATPSDPSRSAEKADIKDGTYKDKKLDLQFDAYDGTVSITGSVSGKGQLSGKWTHSGGDQGTWECKASSK